MAYSNYGRGSLRRKPTKKNKHVWEYRFYYPNDFNEPVRKYLTVHANTEREAWKLAIAKQTAFLETVNKEQTRRKEQHLVDLFKLYINDARHHLQPESLRAYTTTFMDNLKPLHNIPVKKLTAHHIKDALRIYAETPRKAKRFKNNPYPAPRTLQRTYIELGTFMKWLLIEEYIERDFMIHVSKPKLPERDYPAIFSDHEYRQYLQACQEYDKTHTTHTSTVTYFSRTTGMRLGEVLALTFASIDFDTNTVLVNEALNSYRGVKAPKKHSVRRIKVTDEFLDEVRKQQARLRDRAVAVGKAWQGDKYNLLFPDVIGRPQFKNTMSSKLSGIRKRINLRPALKHHNLRHTFATDLINAGVDIKTVKDILGHSQTSTTEHYYQAEVQRSQEDAVAVTSKILSPTGAEALQAILEE
jgi:integrase